MTKLAFDRAQVLEWVLLNNCNCYLVFFLHLSAILTIRRYAHSRLLYLKNKSRRRARGATLKVGGGGGGGRGGGGWLVTLSGGGGWKHLFLSNSLKFPKKPPLPLPLRGPCGRKTPKVDENPAPNFVFRLRRSRNCTSSGLSMVIISLCLLQMSVDSLPPLFIYRQIASKAILFCKKYQF